jgi:hypothetical protein
LAVYRDVANGTWFTSGVLPDEPSGVADGGPSDVENWPHYIELAKAFIDQLKVDRACVVLTIVPTKETRRAEAQAIAQASVSRSSPHTSRISRPSTART